MKCRHPVVDMAEIKARAEQLAPPGSGLCLRCILASITMDNREANRAILDFWLRRTPGVKRWS